MNPKLLSGKFWFTIITGIVFLCTSINGILPAVAIDRLITAVVVFYFTKKAYEPTAPK